MALGFRRLPRGDMMMSLSIRKQKSDRMKAMGLLACAPIVVLVATHEKE